jgi:two-component system KDP operon response regulator KdpE
METSKGDSLTRRQANLPRVLVVDANPGYRSVISHLVELAGGQFESVAELAQAKRQLDGARRFDMVIVGAGADSPITPRDVGKLRSIAQAPLIILTESYDETSQTLDIFKAGADQVLPKPFVPDALIGAIKSEMRRPGPASVVPMATRIELGGLVFDAEERLVTGKEGTASLTKREWQLLYFFLASPNQYFAAREVVSQAWEPDASVEQLRSYVTRLRQKLSPFKAHFGLVTEKGKGYCLVVEVPAIFA